ncbi:MAG TPA: Hsp20/alpha crystallin family protein [Verrucomicrobiae bacterium]|nr:Hsp20/alpha crystallin family protein [Verrucomicrobiae bacterium]
MNQEKGLKMKLRREPKQSRGSLPVQRSNVSPGAQLNRLRNEIDRLFEDPFGAFARAASFFEGWEPSLDVYEDRDKITIKAELAGMKLEDIDVRVDGNTLSISGERKCEEEKTEGERCRSERYFGRFQRSIGLSTAIDAEKVSAKYRDGILTVVCPKAEQAKSRQIEIKNA